MSAGAPGLWRSVMQIDQVSQAPPQLCMLTLPFHGTFFFHCNFIVTGIIVLDETLFYDGVPVWVVTLFDALTGFLNFVRATAGVGKVVLVGHNIESFDAPVLNNMLKDSKVVARILQICQCLYLHTECCIRPWLQTDHSSFLVSGEALWRT